MIECFMNLPPLEEMKNPLNITNILNHQRNDKNLEQEVRTKTLEYPIHPISGMLLVCHVSDPSRIDDWKIVIPPSLIRDVIHWYHIMLGHCGMQRLYDTIAARLYCPRLSALCAQYICPAYCHQYKGQGRQYGHMPPREASFTPWDEVAIDLIGP